MMDICSRAGLTTGLVDILNANSRDHAIKASKLRLWLVENQPVYEWSKKIARLAHIQEATMYVEHT